MPGPLRRQGVRDLLELVGGARVLGLRVVVKVDDAALVDDDVLEDRPERARRLVDLRLGLRREADHLRVAAALEVEDALVAPAVLVVADQLALRIGRERRLAGTGQPEEDRDVAGLADVRRAVHREDALERQAVVHQREDRLLDLARVERAADQHLLARRVEHDECAGAGAVRLRVGLEPGRVQHERLRLELAQLLLARVDEHRPREERVVRVIRDDADGDAMLGVGARERVDDVEVAAAEVRDDLLAQPVEVLLGDLGVDVAPPDPSSEPASRTTNLSFGERPVCLPVSTTSGPPSAITPFSALERVVVEERARQVPMDGPEKLDAVLSQSDAPALLRARRHRAGHHR